MKDQIYLFIYNDLTFKFADINIMFLFFSSIYNNTNQHANKVSAFRDRSQRNKAFTKFMLEFTCLITDVKYTDNQSKIELLSIKLLDKMNQLLIDQDMATNYLGYITQLNKLDINVCIINQQKNLYTNF